MAPKQQTPPPSDSSSDDEELSETNLQTPQPKQSHNSNSSDSEQDESSSEEENENPSVDKSDSGSDEDDDSGSDTDSTESRLKADLVKPSKQAQGKEKKTSTLLVPNASPLKSLQNKAKITASGEGEEKKTLSLSAGASGDVVKPSKQVPNASSSMSLQNKGTTPAGGGGFFVRIFGDDDEVAVLEGMDEFRKKTDRDPSVDKNNFFEFMKKMLKIDVTKAQLMDKVRRLKKKYLNHAKKGDNHVISKPHELKLFELSKKVWAGHGAMKRKTAEGTDDLASEGVKSRKKAKLNLRLAKENGDQEGVWEDYPYFREALEVENSGYFLKRLVDLNEIGPVKAKEMDDEWREFHAKEMELKLLRLKLEKKQTKLVLDSQKP